jgi:hypothetical protein
MALMNDPLQAALNRATVGQSDASDARLLADTLRSVTAERDRLERALDQKTKLLALVLEESVSA